MSLSVCTIAGGRAEHLVNMVHGLAAQDRLPDELVVAVIQPERYALPATPFPIRQVMLGGERLPLAAARNAAARAARSEKLAFLDVDCIPAPGFVADYDRLLDRGDALLMGEILYLPAGATDHGVDYDRFARVGVRHAERAPPPTEALGDCDDYRCFWSLSFAIFRATFLRLGGFDEGYVGYGGEDTDFGRQTVEAGLPIRWCRGALAYHQYHAHHMPPVHHLDSVIANARRFADKWGHYTMEHWLHAFTLMGLIREQDGRFIRLREVDEDDLALTRQQAGQPYASAATVVELLERRAAHAAA